MMYVDQFEVFRFTNRSIMAAQRSQTSRFNEPKEVFSRKHRAHCLKAMPGYWCKIAKHCKQILLPEGLHSHMEGKQRRWNVSINK